MDINLEPKYIVKYQNKELDAETTEIFETLLIMQLAGLNLSNEGFQQFLLKPIYLEIWIELKEMFKKIHYASIADAVGNTKIADIIRTEAIKGKQSGIISSLREFMGEFIKNG